MTVSGLRRRFTRREDLETVAELLGLCGLEHRVFSLRFVERVDLMGIADELCLSYSSVSHISMSVTRKISTLPEDL